MSERQAAVSWRSLTRTLLLSLLVTVLTALLANASLELWQTHGDPSHLQHALTDELVLFLLGSAVIWLVVVLLVAVLGRLWLGVAVTALGTGLLGFATHLKLRLRLEPVFPADLSLDNDVGLLTQMVGTGLLVGAVAGALAVVAGAFLLGRRLGRRFPRPDRRGQPRLFWGLVAVRLAVVAVSVSCLAYVAGFHNAGNAVRAAYDEHGAHWRPWNQSRNYTDNGFVAGMLYNLPVAAMARPAGYGPAAIRRLVHRYAEVAARVNDHREWSALEDVNVVLVLSETFSDPTRYAPVRLAQDPIPFTRALMQRTTSGNMLSVKYGGGTANVEFEVLTGMSTTQLEPQLTTPFQMLVPDHETFPSAVGFFEDQGLETTALHSYSSRLYRRADAYRVLGFDEALFDRDMTHTGGVEQNPYVSDRATFREVLDVLAASDGPQFMNVVTMQNHYPSAGHYEEPIPATGLVDAAADRNLEHYARGLRYSDDALRGFLRSLDASGEESVVLFYGDHLPPLWHGSGIGDRRKHETPFLVWSTFEAGPPEALPTTSATYLVNHVLETADAPVPPYYALLGALERRLPGMMPGWTVNPANDMVPWDGLPQRTRALLRDYRLVQYDLAVGQRYGAEAMFDLPAGP